jgi:hypothetical protein
MNVRRVEDASAFRDAVTPLLMRDEARHNLFLGLASALVERPDRCPDRELWLVEDGGDVVGAALRTPPRGSSSRGRLGTRRSRPSRKRSPARRRSRA